MRNSACEWPVLRQLRSGDVLSRGAVARSQASARLPVGGSLTSSIADAPAPSLHAKSAIPSSPLIEHGNHWEAVSRATRLSLRHGTVPVRGFPRSAHGY
jgi:hypothetical protein